MDINALTQTPADLIHPSSNITSIGLNGTSSLGKRYDFKQAPFKCHGLDYGYAAVDSVTAGIKHLTSGSVNKGKPSNAALDCGRVSCSDNAAIWWCNNVRPSFPCFIFNRFMGGVLIRAEQTTPNNRLIRRHRLGSAVCDLQMRLLG